MLERNPENSPRCKAVLIENTWKYLPFNLGRPHWCVSSSGHTSLCSSCKLILTNLQDVGKNVPPSLSASTPCWHPRCLHHPSRLPTHFHNLLHANDCRLQLTVAWRHPESSTPPNSKLKSSKSCFLPFHLSPPATSLASGNLATSYDCSDLT